jgi:hypothetical protein
MEKELLAHASWLLQQANDEWLPAPRTPFHAWASCILSQRISYATSREDVRQYLYKLWGDNQITSERLLALTPAQREHLQTHGGITQRQLDLLETMARLHRAEPTNLLWNAPGIGDAKELRRKHPELKGIGTWTCNAVQIYARFSNNILLQDDKYILAHLCAWSPSFHNPLTMTPAKRTAAWNRAVASLKAQHTRLSLILWKLKKESRWKVSARVSLTSKDFHIAAAETAVAPRAASTTTTPAPGSAAETTGGVAADRPEEEVAIAASTARRVEA